MAKILIVDDEPDMLDLLTAALIDDGFETVPVLSGAAAIEAYRADRPDAVLLDLIMPAMDGLTTLAAIRQIDPNARVAMLTALGTHAAVKKAVAMGARDFVLKPFDLERVRDAVDSLLAA